VKMAVIQKKYEGCPKVLEHFMYISQNEQEMSKIFSVVNFECHDCYCSVAEQIFSRMLRVSSKWRGRLISGVNNGLSLNFFSQGINE